MKPKLTLTFDAGLGERFSMCIDLEEHVASKMERVLPPSSFPGVETFESVVEKMLAKKFRKDKFIAECHRLGSLLAERMEDAEGWNDESRIEPAKKELKNAIDKRSAFNR
jgi:hypothetical protein